MIEHEEAENFMISKFLNFIDVSEKTESIYRRALKQLFRYFEAEAINAPERTDIINFRKHIEHSGHKPATTALYMTACRRFFSWTAQTGIYPNVAAGVKSPKQDYGHKRDFFQAKQIMKILNCIDRTNPIGRRNFAIIALMAVGGLRTIEIVRANIEDLRMVDEHMCLFIQGKDRKSKADFVKVPVPVYHAIREYLLDRSKTDGKDPLFASMSYRNADCRLSGRSISNICKNAMQEAGFNSCRLTAHSLRHTAITLSLMAGISLSDVQAFARHKCITTTMIYAHHVDRLKSACEDTICDAIF